VLAVTDEFGAIRSFANDAIMLEIDGPAVILGDNPFALVGGTGAIWIRAKEGSGVVHLRGHHPVLGTQEIQITVTSSTSESA
jgi:beta-galactosidase